MDHISYPKARCSGIRASILLLAFVLGTSACNNAPPVRLATPTSLPTTTPTPTPTPTALPSAAPVHRVAGWTTASSPNWCGYVFPRYSATGVRAQWQEPSTTGDAGSWEYTWIGLGGWNETYSNIVQVGTYSNLPTLNTATHGAWYETLPPNRANLVGLVGIQPGDQIFASIDQVGTNPQRWRLLLVDVTLARTSNDTTLDTFDTTVQFASAKAYADFVVESPDKTENNGPPFYALPRFSPVTFSNAQVRIGDTWVSAASVYGFRVQLIRNGAALATAGPLSVNSAFTVTQA